MKLNKIFHITLLLCVATLNPSCQNLTAVKILEEVNKNSKNINALHYKVTFKQKYLDNTDTTSHSGEVWIEKNITDTLLGYNTQIKTEKGNYIIYTTENLYSINNNKKRVTTYDPKTDGLPPIKGNVSGSLLFKELIKGINVKSLKTDSIPINLIEKKDEVYWLIQIEYKDDAPFSKQIKKIWINKKSYLPIKMTYQVKFNNQYQYSEIEVIDLKVNQSSTSDLFKNIKIPNDYEVKQYKKVTMEDVETIKLKNGTTPPNFTINDMKGKSITLSDLKGKVVLLDYFYMSCYPCLQSLPKIKNLYAKYKNNDFTILAINPLDDNKEKLQKFIKEKEIEHTILMSPRSITDEYHLMAYPTFYLIGRDGKIIYSEIGYNPDNENLLEEKIKEALDSK